MRFKYRIGVFIYEEPFRADELYSGTDYIMVLSGTGNLGEIKKFCDEFEIVIGELFRVLKHDKCCAILIGDTRRGRHYVPLAYYVMERFMKRGFVLKEDIIKAQHNCKKTNATWKGSINQCDFYLIMHEHLFVFRKPGKAEDLSKIRYSVLK